MKKPEDGNNWLIPVVLKNAFFGEGKPRFDSGRYLPVPSNILTPTIPASLFCSWNLKQVCREQLQLDTHEQDMLHVLLERYSDLFDGTLGKWKMEDYDIELRPDASLITLRHIQFLSVTLTP